MVTAFAILAMFLFLQSFFSKYLANQLLFNFFLDVHASSLKVWCPIIHDPQPLLRLNIYASIYIYILSIHTNIRRFSYRRIQCKTMQYNTDNTEMYTIQAVQKMRTVHKDNTDTLKLWQYRKLGQFGVDNTEIWTIQTISTILTLIVCQKDIVEGRFEL